MDTHGSSKGALCSCLPAMTGGRLVPCFRCRCHRLRDRMRLRLRCVIWGAVLRPLSWPLGVRVGQGVGGTNARFKGLRSSCWATVADGVCPLPQVPPPMVEPPLEQVLQ